MRVILCYPFYLLLLILIGLADTCLVVAQPYSLKQYNSTQGLPNNLVYVSFCDSRGLIWCGTESGLALFQGNRFIPFIHKSGEARSMLGGQIFSITEDDKGNLWIGSYANGILIFNPFKNTYKILDKKKFPELVRDKIINSMFYLGHKTILVNTSRGAYEINSETLKSTPILPVKYQHENVFYYKQFQGNQYYLCNQLGLLEKNKLGTWRLISSPVKDANYMSVNVIQGQLIVTGYNKSFILQHDQLIPLKIMYQGKDISSEGVNDLIENKQGHIFINSLKFGMLEATFIINTFFCHTAINDTWFAHGNAFYSNFYLAKQDQFFAGTQQGLYHLKPSSALFKETNPKDSIGSVRSLQVDGERLLVGTDGNLFSYTRFNRVQSISEKSVRDQRVFTSHFIQGRPNEWLGIGNKMISIQEGKSSLFNKLQQYFSKQENILTACKLNESIYVFTNTPTKCISWNTITQEIKETNLFMNEAFSPPCLIVHNKIILHTFAEIFEYDPHTFDLNKIPLPESSTINDLQYYNHQIFLSSSTGGIRILDTNYKVKEEINVTEIAGSNEVRSLLIHKQVIWFSTPRGIGYYNLLSKQMGFFYAGENFNTSNFYAASRTIQQDTVYFGGDNGIVAVNTAAVLAERMIDSVYLLNFSILKNGKPELISNPYHHRFTFEENNLEIQLVHTNSNYPTYFNYQYRLNPESPYIPVDENGLMQLYNLPPKDYQLEIIDKQTQNIKASYNFTISPPWYQTGWFRILLALTIIANIIWITRLYFKRRLIAQQKEIEKQLALQSERDRISIDMHDDLGSGLSSIKLISEMLKRKHSDEDTKQDLNEIVNHAAELTSTMREMVWSLNPRQDQLDKFIHHIAAYSKQFFEPSSIQCQINLPPYIEPTPLNGFLRRNIFLVLKEIQHNIIKHSQANQVHIDIQLEPHKLLIQITDNGKGLETDTIFNNGFYSMQKRIQDCKGTIEWKNRQPGLQFNLSIPLEA